MVRRAPVIRMCVGCRKRAPATELLRVIAVEHPPESGVSGFMLMPDPARRLPGRGAHLHPEPGCLKLAERRRAFGRALRVPGVVDTGPVADRMRLNDVATPATDGGRDTAPTRTTKVGRPT